MGALVDISALDLPAQLERRKKALTVLELAESLSLSSKQIYALVSKGYPLLSHRRVYRI